MIRVIKKLNYNQRRLCTRLPIFLIIIVILLINIISTSSTSTSIYPEAFVCEVKIILDQHDVEYIIGPNCTFDLSMHGNVTCNFSGVGEEFQDIEVRLWADSTENWSTGVGPAFMIFNESGVKRIKVSVTIPHDTYNDTKNVITVIGNWETVHGKNSALGTSGSPIPERINVVVYRTYPIEFTNIESPFYEEPSDWEDSWGYPYIIAVSSIPIVIIGAIIGVYLYKRKKWKEFQDEEKY